MNRDEVAGMMISEWGVLFPAETDSSPLNVRNTGHKCRPRPEIVYP